MNMRPSIEDVVTIRPAERRVVPFDERNPLLFGEPQGAGQVQDKRHLQFSPTPFSLRDPAAIPRRQFLYGRHYIRDFLSATVAPSGVGKSSLSIARASSGLKARFRALRNCRTKPICVHTWTAC